MPPPRFYGSPDGGSPGGFSGFTLNVTAARKKIPFDIRKLTSQVSFSLAAVYRSLAEANVTT